MNYKWIGAFFIIWGCGGVGFSIAANYKRKEKLLNQLTHILHFMESELQYRLTPLPELCHQAGYEVTGLLREIFLNLARELDWQCSPDVRSCMSSILKKYSDMPACIKKMLVKLGNSLGRYDLPGQLRGIQAIQTICEGELRKLGKDRDSRLRSYQTLGLCAGAAMVILFV